MITANLYPTANTYPQGDNSELTAEITNYWYSTVDSITIDSLESYWLGYISKDNLPQDFKQGVLYVDNGKLVVKDCTDTANFPCGYVYHTNSSSANLQKNLYRNIDGTESWTANSSTRLINQLYPEYAGVGYTAANSYYGYALNIKLLGALYDMGGNLLNIVSPDYTISENGSISFSGSRNSVKQAFDFLFNNATTRLHWRHGNTDYYFECTASDFESGSAFLTDTTEHVQLRAFITSYELQSNVRLYSGNAQNFLTTFAVKVSATYNDSHRTYIRSYIGQYDEFEWWEYSDSSFSIKDRTAEDPYYAVGWGNDEIDVSEIERINAYTADSGVPYAYTEKTFMCRHRQSGRQPKCCFHHIIPIDSIQKHFSLAFRVDVSGILTPSYVANFTYATDVTANNEFLAKLKTGNLTDASFKNGLREWQYSDFQSDEFDETDIPPYVPPEPPEPPRPDPEDPGEDETDGDDAKPNDPSGLGGGFRFTTQYALSATHLRELGAKLWQGFGNINNYINNFTFNVDPDTGSVNFADIMQFFISLRAYPCPISAMATTSAGGTDMRIGSGATPIELTTNFSVVDSYIGQINAGSVSIPFWYGDYRDYALEIIAYLPYCGTVELNPGDVMGGTLNAFYTVDLCTGACMGYLTCTTWENKTIWVGALPGQLGADVPLTATNAGQVAARMYGDRINFADTVLGVVKSTATGIGAAMSGNLGGFAGQMINATVGSSLELERQNAGIGARGAIAAPMLSGGRGFASFGTSKTAYVQIRSPFYAAPANYAQTVGNPSTSAVRIGDCSGFARFVNVDVTGITTDADDQQAIRRALETGVII